MAPKQVEALIATINDLKINFGAGTTLDNIQIEGVNEGGRFPTQNCHITLIRRDRYMGRTYKFNIKGGGRIEWKYEDQWTTPAYKAMKARTGQAK